MGRAKPAGSRWARWASRGRWAPWARGGPTGPGAPVLAESQRLDFLVQDGLRGRARVELADPPRRHRGPALAAVDGAGLRDAALDDAGPGVAGLDDDGRVRGQLEGAPGDAVGLDVVRVAIGPVVVVGDHDLRADLTDDGGQGGGRLLDVRLPEGARIIVAGCSDHAGVPPPARAAEIPVVGDAERPAGGVQLTDPVAAQLVVAVGGQGGQARRDNLPEFTERARHERDVRSAGGVFRHRRPGADGFVIGVGVHQQQALAV